MQRPDFDKRTGPDFAKITIATFYGFAMLTHLFAGIGGGKNGLNFRL
ncbi:MAG: hypothetical protein WBN22_09155 [Verrucomicrobiia bacterium]